MEENFSTDNIPFVHIGALLGIISQTDKKADMKDESCKNADIKDESYKKADINDFVKKNPALQALVDGFRMSEEEEKNTSTANVDAYIENQDGQMFLRFQ